MILFRSTPRPIWRQTWLRLLLLSGSTAGLVMLVAHIFPSDWIATAKGWVTSATFASADSNKVEVFNEADAQSEEKLQQLDTVGVISPYIALTKLSHSLTERVLQKEQAVVSYNQAIQSDG
ncbi:MAG: hypothetical protein F6K11_03860, partial [Leptolyngbya sp. SIO3F4]|nr:hypothetical protein [Leptolyngbya sp. SIO3F4]